MGRPARHWDARKRMVCGPIQAVYIRRGAESRLVKLGRMCLRCLTLWRDETPASR